MRARYENWVEGLTGDWLVSRQRFFGVPFPVWYPLDADGRSRLRRADPRPARTRLPVDPSADVPAGYTAEQRGQPGGFAGDPDVMDTWATSSLTPQIAGRWEDDPDLFARVFPMDLRPQAHEIIRTWLFSTVRAVQLEVGVLPWRHAAISGWMLDPDRKKMSKSRGNVVTPMDSLDQHGSDAVRYWAASGRLGTDIAFDPAQLRVGRRLAIKILNAVRGSPLGRLAATPGRTGPARARRRDHRRRWTGPCWPAWPAWSTGATAAFEDYDHARALSATEAFFWFFCDDYLELVKTRAYGERGQRAAGSARAALRAGAVGPAPAVRAVPAVRHRGGVVVVAGRVRCTGRLAEPAASWRARSGGRAALVLDVVAEVLGTVRRTKTRRNGRCGPGWRS